MGIQSSISHLAYNVFDFDLQNFGRLSSFHYQHYKHNLPPALCVVSVVCRLSHIHTAVLVENSKLIIIIYSFLLVNFIIDTFSLYRVDSF